MIKKILIAMVVAQSSFAGSISLQNLLDKAEEKSGLKEAILQEDLSRKAASQADNLSEPLTLFGAMAKADPAMGKKEDEYSIGVSKNILLYHTKSRQEEISTLENQGRLLEEEKTLLGFENGLKDLYHQHCIDRYAYQSMQSAYNDFEALYRKKEKAYKFQEISKVELIQLQMEKETLYAQLQEARALQSASKQNLIILAGMDKRDTKPMLCKDIYPIKREIVLPSNRFQYTKDAYQKFKQSTQKKVQRYDQGLESIELSVQYDKELDMDRYSVGFSIPLSFTSERSEKKRLEAMHQNSALQHRYEYTMNQKESELFALKSELKSKAMMVEAQAGNLKDYRTDLLPLMQKGYEAGEKSLLEFLVTKQQYRMLQQEYYQNKKSYYHTLFKLFALIETKDHL